MGTFAAGAELEVGDGRLRVIRSGTSKLVEHVGHVTFSAAQSRARGQEVLYITERCVLRLGPMGLELAEIAPGLDLEADLLAHMGFRPMLAPDLREMDEALFREAPLVFATEAIPRATGPRPRARRRRRPSSDFDRSLS
jgi:propionate CoA-transferase